MRGTRFLPLTMSPRNPIRLAVLSALVLARAAAHECWLQVSDYTPAVGATVRLAINVGMDFRGERREFTPARVAHLRHFSAAGVEDWTDRATGQTELPVAFATAGTHVVAFDSTPSLITLEAGKFHDYLREEGLEAIIALREQTSEAAKPGRERYRRCNKVLVQTAGVADATWAVRTGQRLELVPLADPATVRPGGALGFVLLLDGRPLANAAVRAWHRDGDPLITRDARTNAAGEVSFTLPAAGLWMFSTVHMRRLTGEPDADWESLWGNLTLALASR